MALRWKKKLPNEHLQYVKAVTGCKSDIPDLVHFVIEEKKRLERLVIDYVLSDYTCTDKQTQSIFNNVRSYTTCKPFSQFIPKLDPKKLSTWAIRDCRLLPLCPWCRIKLITKCHIWQKEIANKRSNFVQLTDDSYDSRDKLDKTIKKLRNKGIHNTLVWFDCVKDNRKTINILTPKINRISEIISDFDFNDSAQFVDNITHNNMVDKLSEFVKWDIEQLSYPQNFINVYNLWKNQSSLYKIKVPKKFPKCLVST